MAKTEDHPASPDEAAAALALEEREAYLAFRAGRHNRRLARDADGMTVTGLRMHPAGNAETGVVVNFTPDEAAKVMAAVSSVLKARLDTADAGVDA